ncbi:MAG: hypothetical protein JKZ00_05480 [Flavobacteriaceae bacterium]|nr:hypothetical protein [Flavobacteriaceae bacterium]
MDSQIIASVKKDIWIPFMESYRDLDSKKLISIHDPEIVRVSINSNKIESGTAYLENIKLLFKRVRKMGRQMNIVFSIVSSATTENKVYQTGYYVFSSRANDKEPFQARGYSFFSVLLTKDKESGIWKISLDSDKQVQFTKDEFMKSGTIYTLD